MQLEIILLSEIKKDSERETLHDFSHMQNMYLFIYEMIPRGSVFPSFLNVTAMHYW